MSCALTLLIPTTKAPPGAWSVADAVRTQVDAVNAEILVATGNAIADPIPDAPVRVLHLPGADVFELRAAGLAEARGEVIVMLEDHNYPTDDFCARILGAFDAHPEADGVVGSATNVGSVSRADARDFTPPLPAARNCRISTLGRTQWRAALRMARVRDGGWVAQ